MGMGRPTAEKWWLNSDVPPLIEGGNLHVEIIDGSKKKTLIRCDWGSKEHDR
jgi:hypothetical protein